MPFFTSCVFWHSACFYGTSCGFSHPTSNSVTSSLRSDCLTTPTNRIDACQKIGFAPDTSWHPFKSHFDAWLPPKPWQEIHTLTTSPVLCCTQAARTCALPQKHESWVSIPLPQISVVKHGLLGEWEGQIFGWIGLRLPMLETWNLRIKFNILSWKLGSATARDAYTFGYASAESWNKHT